MQNISDQADDELLKYLEEIENRETRKNGEK